MQFTERDVEILKFINEFGFCEMPQIERRFSLKSPRSYQVMKRLTDADLVIHERVFHGRHGVFYLTHKGARNTELPPIKNIPKDTYIHQLNIINVYFKLMQQHKNAEWVSERRIYRDKQRYSIGNRNKHFADAIFMFDDKQIAIEVELTMKSKKRLKDIFIDYGLQKRIQEVWYFCSPEIIHKIRMAAEKWEHVKIHSLE